MSGSQDGLNLLKTILENNPDLAKNITADALCAKRSVAAEDFENVSVLYYLSATPEGRKLLKTILENNPELAGNITADSLCVKRTTKVKKFKNTSALNFLSASLEGKELLKMIESCQLVRKLRDELVNPMNYDHPLFENAYRNICFDPLQLLEGNDEKSANAAKMFF